MTKASSSRVRRLVVVLAALAASMAFVVPAAAERELFFEETAEAFWAVPHHVCRWFDRAGDAAGAEHA